MDLKGKWGIREQMDVQMWSQPGWIGERDCRLVIRDRNSIRADASKSERLVRLTFLLLLVAG